LGGIMISLMMILNGSAASADSWKANLESTYHHMSYLIDRGLVGSTDGPLGHTRLGLYLESHSSDSGGYHYRAFKAFPSLHFQSSQRMSYDLAAGEAYLHNYLESHAQNQIALFYLNLMASFQARVDTKFQLRLGQDLIHQNWYDPSLARLRLAEKIIEGTFDYNPGRVRTHGQVRRAWLSDGNIRDGYEGYALYQVSQSPVEFRTGIGVWEVAFRDRNPDYWTPREMVNLDVRFEFDLHPAENWYAQSKFYFGRSHELGKAGLGETSYQEFRLYRHWRAFDFGLYYVRWNSINTDYVWWREDTGFSMTRAF
jgi:hypothetical protein